MNRGLVFLLLLAFAGLGAAQICRRAPTAGFCRAPSPGVMQELSSAQSYAYSQVLEDVEVLSPYDGRDQSGCGGGGCKINQSAARQRAKTLAPAQAFAAIARDIPEWYLKSKGAGCPNQKLITMYTTVMMRWAEKGGFLGAVSEQGVLEVDWKIVTIAAGYSKMKAFIDAKSRGVIEQWISKLHDVTSKRKADADNNHLIWHINALVWASLALGKYGQAAQDISQITAHMNKYINSEGVILSEGRCQKTLHYHAYYLEAALGTMAGYKYHTGTLPAGWPGLAARVAESLKNINNPSLGTERAIKAFGYTGDLKNCRNINPADKGDVVRTNAIFQAVSAARGVLAPCAADSSYFGNFRLLPFMWRGAVNPPLGRVCCNS